MRIEPGTKGIRNLLIAAQGIGLGKEVGLMADRLVKIAIVSIPSSRLKKKDSK